MEITEKTVGQECMICKSQDIVWDMLARMPKCRECNSHSINKIIKRFVFIDDIEKAIDRTFSGNYATSNKTRREYLRKELGLTNKQDKVQK